MKESRVGIIILNYFTYDLTLKLLERLENLKYQNFFIVVVDNNSPNNSKEILINNIINQSKFSNEIYFIEAKKNGGYSYGNNIGIRKAFKLGAKYILIINNDVDISNFNILKIMVNFCEKNEKVAMVGPKIVDSNDNLDIPYISRPLVWDYIKRYLLFPFFFKV
jgi:GT2 family glycosyltransferase